MDKDRRTAVKIARKIDILAF